MLWSGSHCPASISPFCCRPAIRDAGLQHLPSCHPLRPCWCSPPSLPRKEALRLVIGKLQTGDLYEALKLDRVVVRLIWMDLG